MENQYQNFIAPIIVLLLASVLLLRHNHMQRAERMRSIRFSDPNEAAWLFVPRPLSSVTK